jgi:ATP/maltotriose-dependent transcriptional regulator MalT
MLMLSSATRNRHGCVLCEEEVLRCLFDGQSNKAIGALLFVSVDTVKTHLKRIYSKLGATDRNHAVARAREIGMRGHA